MTTPDGPDIFINESAFPTPPAQAPPGDGGSPYPTRFKVDYPEHLSRWKTGFRVILILPVFLFLFLIAAIGYSAMSVGWITVFFRRSYPPWVMAAHTGFLGFLARTSAYLTLLTDQYPSFAAADGPVRLEYPQPEPGSLSRWRVFLWKFVLIIPHLIVLWFLSFAITVVVFLSWFAILFTGNYPRGMFAFTVGIQRWSFRLHGYFASFHDEYPPFSLSEDSRKADKTTTVISGVVGGVIVVVIVALTIVAIILAAQPQVVDVNYARLENDSPSERIHRVGPNTFHIDVQLLVVDDDSSQYARLAGPQKGRAGHRLYD